MESSVPAAKMDAISLPLGRLSGRDETAPKEFSWPWEAPDGTVLPCAEWRPCREAAPPPPAVVLAIHGLGGNGSDFRPLGMHLGRDNVVTYAPDLRGQGTDPSLARRGNLRDLREAVDDLAVFFNRLTERHPGTPIFLYGESMGAVLSVHLAARGQDSLAGLVLASPVIDFEVPLSWWRHGWFQILAAVAPQLRLPMRQVPARRRRPDRPPPRVTRDEEYTAYLRTAPHRLLSVTPRFLRSLLRTIRACRELVPRLRLPTLALAAGHDIFIPPACVEAVFARLGSVDKTLRVFPESYHLLLHDHDRTEVLAVIQAWLRAHLPQGSIRP